MNRTLRLLAADVSLASHPTAPAVPSRRRRPQLLPSTRRAGVSLRLIGGSRGEREGGSGDGAIREGTARGDIWEEILPERGLKRGVTGLVRRAKYRVIRAIEDYYGTTVPVGEELTFVSRDFLPYHGGHTLVFGPRVIYLRVEVNSDVLSALDTYLERIPITKLT